MITLKLKSGTFWDETTCNLLDGYQRWQKIAASVLGVQEANLDLEDVVVSPKHYDNCASKHKTSYLQTMHFSADLRSSNRVFSFSEAYISNK